MCRNMKGFLGTIRQKVRCSYTGWKLFSWDLYRHMRYSILQNFCLILTQKCILLCPLSRTSQWTLFFLSSLFTADKNICFGRKYCRITIKMYGKKNFGDLLYPSLDYEKSYFYKGKNLLVCKQILSIISWTSRRRWLNWKWQSYPPLPSHPENIPIYLHYSSYQ